METPFEKVFQISAISQESRVVSIEPTTKRRKRTRLSRWMCRFGKTDCSAIVISDFSDNDDGEGDCHSTSGSLDTDDPTLSDRESKLNGGNWHRIELKPFKRVYFHGFPSDENGKQVANECFPAGVKNDLGENDQVCNQYISAKNDDFQDRHRKIDSPKCLALTRKRSPCMHLAVDNSFFCTRHGNYVSKFIHHKNVVLNRSKEDTEAKYKETPFTGLIGQYRCIGLDGNGELCGNQSANGSVYCYTHAAVYSEDMGGVTAEIELDDGTDDGSATSSVISSSTVSDGESSDSSPRPYKYKEFIQMWTDGEEYFGEGTDEIESTRRVRGANSRVSPEDTDGQLKAQYGRLLPSAMKVCYDFWKRCHEHSN